MHIREQRGMDKEEVKTFSEEAGLSLMPKGNMSNLVWEVVPNIKIINYLLLLNWIIKQLQIKSYQQFCICIYAIIWMWYSLFLMLFKQLQWSEVGPTF